MNIDIQCIGLLALILQDSPKDRNLILCILARSNSIPARINFYPNSEYPTFYGYGNSRIPIYLMGKRILSNIPRKVSFLKMLISSHYLSYAEAMINKAGNWDLQQKLMSVSKFVHLKNNTTYKDSEVFLVFRDRAINFIKSYTLENKEKVSTFLGPELSKTIFDDGKNNDSIVSKPSQDQNITSINKKAEWSEDFKWEGKSLIFGTYGRIVFNSKVTKALFGELYKAKGNWVEIFKLKKATGKDEKSYIRPTIGQVERGMNGKLKKYISFPSTRDDDLEPKPAQGAYRIQYSPKSQH